MILRLIQGWLYMIKSMTGFGRYENYTNERKFTVEIKAVNHRYLEFAVRMPKKFGFFETGIRNTMKDYVSRGKIDIFIAYEDFTEGKACVKFNEDIASEYYKHIVNIGGKFDLSIDVRAIDLARLPEVFAIEEQTVDEGVLWEMLEDTLKEAAKSFVESRISEGGRIRQDIVSKLGYMSALISDIEERSPEIITGYRDKLTNKVKELIADNQLDEGRIMTEVAIFADKICTDEETVRLRSHIEGMVKTLNDGTNVGRKLDFIAQEMNREANTLLSKSSDLLVSDMAINLKTEIEKVREQIQNIE